MPVYTKSALKSSCNGRIYNKQGQLVSYDDTINNAVREVIGDIDLRSSKRQYSTPAKLFSNIYDYTCPTDLKGDKLIDIQPQVNREATLRWTLTTEQDFDIRKTTKNNLITFSDKDLIRKIRISRLVDDNTVLLAQLDSLTGDGGTWTAFGDATNLVADSDNYVRGNGSIKWDISAAGGTTAGIYGTINSQDISDQIDGSGSAFVWTYITSTTNITNYKLRLGSDSSNYHEYTTTTASGGTAFTVGWNLLQFSLSSPTDTGTPTDTAIDYVAIYMTKDAAKISETDYRFDWLVVKNGDYYNILYYSKYLWQSSTGTWKENSTADSDYINLDTEEVQLLTEKIIGLACLELREEKGAEYAIARYDKLKEAYLKSYKSEKLRVQNQYYNLLAGKGIFTNWITR